MEVGRTRSWKEVIAAGTYLRPSYTLPGTEIGHSVVSGTDVSCRVLRLPVLQCAVLPYTTVYCGVQY
eukprot:3635142-Rhodomonas_salina.1